MSEIDPKVREQYLREQGIDPAVYDFDSTTGEIFRRPVAEPASPVVAPSVGQGETLLRSAGEAIAPTAGGIGATAAAMRALAAWAPHPVVKGAALLGTALAGGIGTSVAQDKVARAVIGDEARDAHLRRLAAGREQHPVTSMAGEFLPSAGVFTPAAGVRALPTLGAAAKKAIMPGQIARMSANQKAALLNAGISGGVEAGVEAGQQLVTEGGIDSPGRIVAAAGLGAFLSEPGRLGRKLGFETTVDTTPRTPVERVEPSADAKPEAVRPEQPAEAAKQLPAPRRFYGTESGEVIDIAGRTEQQFMEYVDIRQGAAEAARYARDRRPAPAQAELSFDKGEVTPDHVAKFEAENNSLLEANKQFNKLVSETKVKTAPEKSLVDLNNEFNKLVSDVELAPLTEPDPLDTPLSPPDEADIIQDIYDQTGKLRFQPSSEFFDKAAEVLTASGRPRKLLDPANKDVVDFIMAMAKERGVKNIMLGDFTVPNPATGESFTPAGLYNTETGTVGLSSKAGLDTGFHELAHKYMIDLAEFGDKAQKQAVDSAIKTAYEAGGAWARVPEFSLAGMNPAQIGDEIMAQAVGIESARRHLLPADVKTKLKEFADDWMAGFRNVAGQATKEDFTRLLARALKEDKPFAELAAKAGLTPPRPVAQQPESPLDDPKIQEHFRKMREAANEVRKKPGGVTGEATAPLTPMQRALKAELAKIDRAARFQDDSALFKSDWLDVDRLDSSNTVLGAENGKIDGELLRGFDSVQLKLNHFKSASPEAIDRFIREAELMAEQLHPKAKYIRVKVYEGDDGSFWEARGYKLLADETFPVKHSVYKKNFEGTYISSLGSNPQTQTREFKRWFGDSVVTDGTGRPQPVFHRTKAGARFNEFNVLGSDQTGSHFGTLSQTNVHVSDLTSSLRDYPVFLRIQKPFRMRDRMDNNAYAIAAELARQGKVSKDAVYGLKSAKDDYQRNIMVRELLDSLGYDGIVYLNRHEGNLLEKDYRTPGAISDADFKEKNPEAEDSWIALWPEQVKSAVGNRGTYSLGSNDIRYQDLSPLGDNELFETQLAKKLREGKGNFAPEKAGKNAGSYQRAKLKAAIFGAKSGYSKGEQEFLRLTGLERELSQKGFIKPEDLAPYLSDEMLGVRVQKFDNTVTKPTLLSDENVAEINIAAEKVGMQLAGDSTGTNLRFTAKGFQNIVLDASLYAEGVMIERMGPIRATDTDLAAFADFLRGKFYRDPEVQIKILASLTHKLDNFRLDGLSYEVKSTGIDIIHEPSGEIVAVFDHRGVTRVPNTAPDDVLIPSTGDFNAVTRRIFPLNPETLSHSENRSGPSAIYREINPIKLEDMTEPVDLALVMGKHGARKGERPLETYRRQQLHFRSILEPVLSHVRGYMAETPEGKKVFHVTEIQSDYIAAKDKKIAELQTKVARIAETFSELDAEVTVWLKSGVVGLDGSWVTTKRLELGEAAAREIYPHVNQRKPYSEQPESVRKVLDAALSVMVKKEQAKLMEAVDAYDPLLNFGYEMAIKAAARHALENGADELALSNSGTALMTQGHHTDYSVSIEPVGDSPTLGDMQMAQMMGASVDDLATDRVRPVEYFNSNLDKIPEGYKAVFKVSRQGGMRKFYDTVYPSSISKLTEEAPVRINLGRHKNSKIGHSVDETGERQKDIIVRSWSLGKLKAKLLKDPRFSISNRRFQSDSAFEDLITDDISQQKFSKKPIDVDLVNDGPIADGKQRVASRGLPLFRSTIDSIAVEQGRTGEYTSSVFNALYETKDSLFGRYGNKSIGILDEFKLSVTERENIMRYGGDKATEGASQIKLTANEQKAYDKLMDVFRQARRHQNVEGPLVKELLGGRDPLKVIGDKPWDLNDDGGYIWYTDESKKHVHAIYRAKDNVVYRRGQEDPNFWPAAMPKISVLDTMVERPNTPEAGRLRAEYVEWVTRRRAKAGATKDELSDLRIQAGKDLDDYFKQFSTSDGSAKFSGIRTQAGISLPPSWREDSLERMLTRYYRRYAMDMAYFKHIESDDTARGILHVPDQFGDYSQNLKTFDDGDPFNPIAGSKNVEFVMRDIKRSFTKDDILIDAANRTVKSVMLQGLTGAKDVISAPFLLMPRLRWKDFPTLWKVMTSPSAVKEGMSRSLQAGVATHHTVSGQELLPGIDGAAIRSTLAERLTATADFFYKWSGREFLERTARGITMQSGYLSAVQAIADAKKGDVEAIAFLEKLGPTDPNTSWKKMLESPNGVEELANTVGANLVRDTQGTYDVRGLPTWIIRGKMSPFFSLAKWNVERANNFTKGVVDPLINDGDFKPLLKATIGLTMGGAAVEYIAEKISNRRSNAPTWGDLQNAPDATLGDYTYRLMALASISGQGGILAEAFKTYFDYKNRVSTAGFEFQLYEAGVDFADKVRHAVEAIDEGESALVVMPKLIHELSRAHIQNLRILEAHIDIADSKDKLRRGEERKQLRIFENLSGYTPAPFAITPANPFRQGDVRRFKKTDDLVEAAGLLKEKIIPRVLKETEGRPSQLKKRLSGLVAADRVALPNPDREPEKFSAYLEFLSNTQGPEVAEGLTQRMLRVRQLNKAKNQMIPSVGR